jgi:hypothetical protein
MSTAETKAKIVIEDTERHIYSMHLQEISNRFANAYKIFLLRRDFYDFLERYKVALAGNDFGLITREKGIFPKFHHEEAEPILNDFLDKVSNSDFYSTLDEAEGKYLLRIGRNLFKHYYPHAIFMRDEEVLNKKELIFDPMLNYPQINYTVVFDDDFNELFPPELFYKQIPMGDLSEIDQKRAKTILFTVNGDTGKEELISYIDTFWKEISMMLGKPTADKISRDKASKTFLRNVDIYNQYLEEKNNNDSLSTRDLRTAASVKEKSGEEITDDMVRKIVSDISNLERKVNT